MTIEVTTTLVLPLADPAANLEHAGGKGASLARMARAGLPVPDGFHVTTAAYQHFVATHGLHAHILAAVAAVDAAQPATLEAASDRIAALFAAHPVPHEIATAIRGAYADLGGGNLPVAVRSSATAEDLPDMSFAGQQDTYLNIHGADAVLDAVKRCWASLWTARAIGYRARNAIAPDDVSLAVVVQELVLADAAGIMFTANPMTGARDQIVINAAWGLGEAVVGGQVTPDTIVVDRANDRIITQQINTKEVMTVRTADGTREQPVPVERRTQAVLTAAQAVELAQIGVRLEALYERPMDVEWALSEGRLAIVQARPITALGAAAPVAETWNDTLKGDYVWTSTNIGEAIPDVMTPCTWSLVKIFLNDAMALSSVGEHGVSGNIGGRCYLNLSVTAATANAFGLGKLYRESSVDVFGRMPDGLTIPLLPMTRWQIIRDTLGHIVRFRRNIHTYSKRFAELQAATQPRANELQRDIAATTNAADLARLWQEAVGPFLEHCSFLLAVGARQEGAALVTIRKRVRKLASEEDTNALLTGLHTTASQLASLGPLVGLAQLARGEIDRATYAQQWGHRSPHEFEVSQPRPAEDPAWIEKQLAGLRNATYDVTALLTRQEETRAAAWQRLAQQHPKKVRALRQRIERAANVARAREYARSEVVRAFWVMRTFVLRAGALSGIGDDVFFLPIDEIIRVLGGDTTPLAAVPARRAAYAHYTALPVYPTLIRGSFDPDQWAADPNRRSDVYDATRDQPPVSATITGFGGAVGVVEGRARVLTSVEEGDALKPGEILVTTVTNVGWTPLFPRAAAVVTDVGAPLSHAAIVARELGIPAVVGSGNATMRLHTGDLIRVDGGRGTVEVLSSSR